MFCRRLVNGRGSDRYYNIPRCRRGYVDAVVAHTAARDHAKSRQPVQHVCRDMLASGNQGIGDAQFVDALLFITQPSGKLGILGERDLKTGLFQNVRMATLNMQDRLRRNQHAGHKFLPFVVFAFREGRSPS